MIDNDLLREFLTESQEHLCTVEDDILALERGDSGIDQAIVNRLFRSVHTVKGGAGFLNLDNVKNLAHALENLVGAIRSGQLLPDPKVSEVLLEGTDRLRYLIEHIDDTDATIDEQVAACARLLGTESAAPPRAAHPEEGTNDDAPDPPFDLTRFDLAPVIANQQRLHVGTIDLVAECSAKNRSFAALKSDMESIGAILETDPVAGPDFTVTPDGQGHHWFSFVVACIIDEEILFTAGLDISPARYRIVKPSEIRESTVVPREKTVTKKAPAAEPAPKDAASLKPPTPGQPPTAHSAGVADQTIRISLGLLDNLMNLASELVLVRNQYLRLIALGDLQRLTTIGQRLNVVTSEIQSSIMQTRMRPVGTIFNRFSRVVRDLARKLGKKINLEIRGADVELDKSIIEAIADPMTHLIRNSVDHGIEMPDVRLREGKHAEGSVCLSAFHQAGQVIIQIEDDGKGMDPRHILHKAVEKGLISEEQTGTLSERETFDLIFVPGFSTAEKVTEVSGRGVGMDVVRSGIQALGGTIAISSAPGTGSTIRIELPLTLAIIPALIVSVESTCFAIPQVNIIEVVWLHGSDVYQAIKHVDEREVYWLRGTLLPLMRLSKVLDISLSYNNPANGERLPDRRAQRPDRRQDCNGTVAADERRRNSAERRTDLANSLSIVVLRFSGERFGLVVDAIVDTEEIVVKSLHDQLKDCSAYAGAAVLGNGRVAMILDIMGLATLGKLQIGSTEGGTPAAKRSFDDHQTVLQFNIGGPERFVIPLCLITRVQEVQPDQIKHAHNREYLTYREELIPLIRIEQAVPEFSSDYTTEGLSIIIPKSQKPFGVVVARIIDTIEVPTNLDTGTIHAPCIIGSQLLQGEPTLYIDLLQIMEKIDPVWVEDTGAPVAFDQKRFLVIDDSAFYRNLLGSFLRGSGATVTTADNGDIALKILTEETFDAVISDIEMPVMNGFDFIRAVRERNLAPGVPMLAVSTGEEQHLKPRALDRGFDDFKPKSNLEELLEAVNKLIRTGMTQPLSDRSGGAV
ncbi:MAG: chemotaxis protein CheW [Chitinispirillaceae bacterium]|nr:chemotaxis protein CheW [Chitinispirillaceae bacterium]